ncbi:MAG: hypothetical protein AB7K64_08840 [Variibacter sp.]
MSDGDRNPAESPAAADPARRRPVPPTLDLKATEIASEPTADSSPSPAGTGGEADAAVAGLRPASDRTPSPEEISAAIEEWIRPDEPLRVRIESGDGDPPPPPPPDPPPSVSAAASTPPPSYLGRGIALGLGAALIGAAAALAALWALGQWSPFDDKTAALAARMETLEAAVTRLADRPVAAAVSDQHIAAIAAKATPAGPSAAQLKDIETRLAKVEAALASPAPAADSGLGERLSALDANTKSLTGEIEALHKRLDEVATSTQAARDAAMRSSGAATNAASEMSSDLDTLKQRMAALESKAAQPQPSDVDRAARTASAANALRDAVERGVPYASELAAAKALAAAPAVFAPLDAFATTGLPSAAALAEELRTIATNARGASARRDETVGLFDRLQAHAAKLIRIRPADAPAQPAPGDFAAAEQAAARGDLAAAVAALRAMPETARAPADAWIKRVEARQAALDFARKQSRDAVAALAQQPK